MKTKSRSSKAGGLSDTAAMQCVRGDTAEIPTWPEPVKGKSIPWLARTLLVCAMISGVALMTPVWSAGPLALDEYGTYWMVGTENPGTLWERSLQYENIPPLAPFLQRQICYLFGTTEQTLRMLSIFCYWGAIPAAYLLGRALMGVNGGGISALVLAWHPRVLGEVSIARSYGLTLLLSTLAFWVTLRWSRKPWSWWGFAWLTLNTALVWAHYLNAAVVIPQLLWLAWTFRTETKQERLYLLVMTVLVGVFCTPLIEPLLRLRDWGSVFNFDSNPVWYQVIAPIWWAGIPAAWGIGWILTKLGSRRGTTEGSIARPDLTKSVLLLFAWGLLPAILAAIICRDDLSSLANPRYRIGFAGPSACLIAACVLHRRTPMVAVTGVVVALLVGWSLAPRWPWTMKRLGDPRDAEWRDMAQTIETHGRPGEPLFVQSGLGESFLIPLMYKDLMFHDFAACRLGRFYLKQPHPRYALPYEWTVAPDMVRFFSETLRKHSQSSRTGVWLACATDTDRNQHSMGGMEFIISHIGYREVMRSERANSILIHYEYAPVK